MNLWFTLTIPPETALGLERTVEILRRLAGAERVLSLPTLKRYKLEVRFRMGRYAEPEHTAEAPDFPTAPSMAGERPRRHEVGEREAAAIRALQEPLPAVAEAFARLARKADMAVDDLLVAGADLLAAGIMRRYAGVLRHRQAGAAANVLVAWQVPADQADDFGYQAARFEVVSHCYLRPTGPDWPYSIYTMIHGTDRQAVDRTIESIAASAGAYTRAELPTVREYKKQRVRLLTDDITRWEEAVAG
jgi:DNA-binding Lrp family transcriptional regulator